MSGVRRINLSHHSENADASRKGGWQMRRTNRAQRSALLLIGLACCAGTEVAFASDDRAAVVRSAREERTGGLGDSVECSEGAAGMICDECEIVDVHVITGASECKRTRQGNITRTHLPSRGSRMPSFAHCRTPVRTTSYQGMISSFFLGID